MSARTIEVPAIIADDEEKALAFRAGADEAAHFGAFLDLISQRYPNLFWLIESDEFGGALYREADRLELPWPRERALVNCYRWGRALASPAPAFRPAPAEKFRRGALDSFEFISRNGARFCSGLKWMLDD